MSVTFTISGERANYEAVKGGAAPNFVNFANQNARELLEWLGFETDEDLYGILAPGDLVRRCERRLASTPDNVATDLPRAERTIRREGHATVIIAGASAGRKAERAQLLLDLARRAGDRMIEYS